MSDLEAHALDLFDKYVDLTPSQRSAALARLKDREPALHDALLRLLSADAATHPLEVAAFELLGEVSTKDDADDASMRVGNRLGPWRIDHVLGSGGMGTVYGASRADGQYEKQVALKCMRTEMSSPALIDAFMRERNHLAQLDHPHIAPLLDGGVEADGRPWFAMRLVHGTAMDLWADQQRLGLKERIHLLLQACQAAGVVEVQVGDQGAADVGDVDVEPVEHEDDLQLPALAQRLPGHVVGDGVELVGAVGRDDRAHAPVEGSTRRLPQVTGAADDGLEVGGPVGEGVPAAHGAGGRQADPIDELVLPQVRAHLQRQLGVVLDPAGVRGQGLGQPVDRGARGDDRRAGRRGLEHVPRCNGPVGDQRRGPVAPEDRSVAGQPGVIETATRSSRDVLIGEYQAVNVKPGR